MIVRGLLSAEIKPGAKAINSMMFRCAHDIILAWAGVPLLVKQPGCGITVFDTTALHAGTALDFTLGKDLCAPKS